MSAASRIHPIVVRLEPAGSGDLLWDQLRDCHRKLRAELREVVRAHGLYLSEYRALGRLEEGPRSLSELSQLLGMTPAAMTDLSRQLSRRGWAVLKADPGDRRVRRLEITDPGRRVRRLARREYRGRLADVYRQMSLRGRDSLAGGLRELDRLLESRVARGRTDPRPVRPPLTAEAP